MNLCCLLSSHCPGHHTITHAARGHCSQPDLQCKPGSRQWPCQLFLVPEWGTVGSGPPGNRDAATCGQNGRCPLCLPHALRGWCPALRSCGPECALWVMGKGSVRHLRGLRGWSVRSQAGFGLWETSMWLGHGKGQAWTICVAQAVGHRVAAGMW